MEEMFFSRRKYTKLLRYAIIAVVCLVAYKFIFPGSPTKITMADVGVSADIHKSDSRPNIPVVRVPDEHVKEGNLEALKAPEQVPIVSQTSQAQSVLDYISQSLDVRLKLLSNLVDGGSTYSFTLTNKGPKPIHSYITDNDGKSSWTIYFCFFHMIQSNPRGFLGANKEFRVSRIDGRVWQLQPTDDFKTLFKGQEVVLPFTAGFSISRYDFYPNWYLTVPELQPRIIQSTHDEALTFVDPLTEPQQWMRSRQDQFKPYSPEERFESNGAIKDLGGHQQPIIPTPFKIRTDTSQEFDFSDPKLWHIVASDAKLLANEIQILKSFTGIEYSDEGEDHRIQLEIGPVNVVDSPPLTSKSEENYQIDMTADTRNIKIVAEKPAGIYYGIRSLLHLIDHQQKMPVTQILDGPRFPYRGLMLDVSRNFFGKRTILELIDTMSMYKLNRLHFHLSDDQGWRLEIPGLPELTEVGARRGHDLKESETLLPYEGSGPFTNSSGSGYFTVSDFREILLHAKNNHIEIIPELDMPGHSHAAIQSMKVRHDRLMAKGLVKEAEEYLISDPQDTSVYEAVGSNRESALNPCRESTYTFVEKVINEVYDIYKVITPMKVLHIGGDEVPWGAYKESPICSKFRKEHPEYTNALDLKFYFIKRVSEIVAKKHLKLQMWEDGVLNSDTDKLADLSGMSVDDLISNSWQNRWEKGEGSRAYRLANRGVKVVLGHATHLYLDHPQEPDPEERGLYWATRYSDSVRIFKYSPESVYDNMDSTLYTKTLDKEEICNNFKDACLPLEKTENIIGMEGALWTELVRTQEQMFSQLFPRAIAMAERAWYKADWEWEKDLHSRERMKNEAWEKFANSLGYRELKRLGKPEYISGRPFMAAQTYYLPPPGVKIVGNEIHVNVCFPGTVVQYYDRDAEQWKDIPGEILQYKGEKLQFRTRGEKQGGVTSRTITIGSG